MPLATLDDAPVSGTAITLWAPGVIYMDPCCTEGH